MRHRRCSIGGKIPALIVAVCVVAACGGSAIVVTDPARAIGSMGSTAPTSSPTAPPPALFADDDGARFLFADAFEDGSDEFAIGSDGHIVSEVAGGALRFELIDVGGPQALRHELSAPQPHVRFEATVTIEAHHVGGLGIGCWRGERSFMALLTGDRFFGIFEGSADGGVRILHDMTRSRYLEGATEPNRVRVDCMTDHGAAWFSLFVNGTPLAGVALPGILTGFDAVGFTGNSDWPGARYRVDDVLAVHCLEAPAVPVVDLEDFEATVGRAWFERDGLGFAYPRDWIYGRNLSAMPGSWAFVVAPESGDSYLALALATSVGPDQLASSPAESAAAILELMLPGGASVAVQPDEVTISGVSGFAASFQRPAEGDGGHPLGGRAVVMFSDFGALLLLVQYSTELEDIMLRAWQGALDSFHP